jgi:hypothetical protein
MKATSPPNFSKIKKKCPYGCLLSRDRGHFSGKV